jgi:hypothetical protein
MSIGNSLRNKNAALFRRRQSMHVGKKGKSPMDQMEEEKDSGKPVMLKRAVTTFKKQNDAFLEGGDSEEDMELNISNETDGKKQVFQ